MSILQFEEAIIARLTTDIAGVQIEPFPDDPRNYKMIHPVGAILVNYEGARFEKGKAIGFVNQVSEIRFRMNLIMKHLRTHQGIYAYLDLVKESLTGFQIAGLSKMEPVEEKYLDQRTGLWYYYQVFKANGRVLEQAA